MYMLSIDSRHSAQTTEQFDSFGGITISCLIGATKIRKLSFFNKERNLVLKNQLQLSKTHRRSQLTCSSEPVRMGLTPIISNLPELVLTAFNITNQPSRWERIGQALNKSGDIDHLI